MRLWFDRQGDVSLKNFTIDDLALLFMQYAEGYYVVALGHPSASITEVYAEMDQDKAREVMAKIG